ncbi:MAG: SMP-30/gluconolactonase/LRE family protein [Planctomycetota bacterium]
MKTISAALLGVCVSMFVSAESPFPDEPVVETVAEGFRFTEGPALAPDGSIWFTDIPNHAIHRFDPATGETSLITDDSGGANGLFFFGDRLVVCEDRQRRSVVVHRLVEGAEGRGTIDAGSPLARVTPPQGRFNGPNDAVVHRSGSVGFFTDPLYGQRPNPLPSENVYRVTAPDPMPMIAPVPLRAEPIVTDLVSPNGIGLSPDQRTLYVADNGAKLLMAYPLDEQGSRDGEGVLFHDVSDLGGPDGMTVDSKGRVYQTIFNLGVVVISPEGERLGVLETGPRTSNCVLTADERTLYITSENKLKRVTLKSSAIEQD